jgi:hypothetical protein
MKSTTICQHAIFQRTARYATLALLVFTLSFLLSPAPSALASGNPFSYVGPQYLSPPPPWDGVHGIARIGTDWYLANFTQGWHIYDSNFVQTGTVTGPFALGHNRPLALNTNTGNLYTGNFSTGIIYEVTPAGAIVNSFSSGGPTAELNAIAYNPLDDSIYAVHFNGFINHLSSGGVPLNNFTLSSDVWTGAAFDTVSNTLLLLESSSDIVKEYSPLGVFVGTPLPTSSVAGNGQGLHYDSATGVLHVTAQNGNLAVWQRQVIPEPSSLFAIILAGVVCAWCASCKIGMFWSCGTR